MKFKILNSTSIAILSDGTCAGKGWKTGTWTAIHPDNPDNPAKSINAMTDGWSVRLGAYSATISAIRSGKVKSLTVKTTDEGKTTLAIQTKEGQNLKGEPGQMSQIHIWKGPSDTWGKLCANQHIPSWNEFESERIKIYIDRDGMLADTLEESLKHKTTAINPVESIEEGTHEGAKWTGDLHAKKGMKVEVTFNNLGKGEIAGFFTLDNFIGAFIRPEAPPQWWKDQNPGRKLYTAFGPEIKEVQ